MNLKKVKHITYAFGVGIALMAVLCLLTKRGVFVWLMLACALATAYVETTLWRCPHCGKVMGHFDIKFCPHCGKELDDLK